METMHRRLSAMAVGFLLCTVSASAQPRPTFPIAYISVQKVLAEADDAKAATKELEAMRAAKAGDLNAKKKALDDTKLQLANAGGFFSSNRRAQLAELVKKQESELQQATQQAQTEFNDLQKKVQERLRAELNTVLTALAVQRGVPYVLNQDTAIVLAPTAANWTAEVLERLNAATAQRQKTATAPTQNKSSNP
jgi:Skp family chaperone for outer membrane proteins